MYRIVFAATAVLAAASAAYAMTNPAVMVSDQDVSSGTVSAD
jgi:hypothetical protein